MQATSAVTGQSIQQGAVLASALKNIAPIQTAFPDEQRPRVAIEAGGAGDRGAQRAGNQPADFLLLASGGFDTHSDQLATQVRSVRATERGDGRVLWRRRRNWAWRTT